MIVDMLEAPQIPIKMFRLPASLLHEITKRYSARERRVSDETSINRSLLQVADGEVIVSCEAS